MRTRYTRSPGMPVVDAESGETLGSIDGIVLRPQGDAVEGFFVRVGGGMFPQKLFLAATDIAHWGTRVAVRGRDPLAPVGDLIRLQSILESNCPVLGQSIVTESGVALGRCRDVQFDTKLFRVEWLFPKKFFRWALPVSTSQIIRVTPEAVVVKDPAVEVKADMGLIPPVPEAA